MSEIEHRYGENVHIIANPFLLGQLATLCAKETRQPEINRLVRLLYEDLIRTVLNVEFPRRRVAVPTRMIDSSPQAIFEGEVIDRSVRAVTVNIARAGAVPSQVVYDLLNETLDPSLVRQDHIIMSRMLGENEEVVGRRDRRDEDRRRHRRRVPALPRSDGRDRRVARDGDRDLQEEGPRHAAADREHPPHPHPRVPADHDEGPPGRARLRDPARPRPLLARRPRHRARAPAGTRSAGSTTTSTSSPAAAASGRS